MAIRNQLYVSNGSNNNTKKNVVTNSGKYVATPTTQPDFLSRYGNGTGTSGVTVEYGSKVNSDLAKAISDYVDKNPSSNTTTTYTGASLDVPGAYQGSTNNSGGNSYYDPSADLAAAYNARQAAQRQNYENAIAQARNAYNTNVNELKRQSDDALRQAYINMMMDKRGLGQSLEAQGLRGGASESALAGIFNNYANNRNSIAEALAQNLAAAGNKYGENIADLGLKYNENNADAMADYQNQLVKARQTLANQLAKTSSNVNGTQLTADSYADVINGLFGNNNTDSTNNLVKAAQTANAVPEYQGDLSSEMQQYRIRNYTPAKIRNMAPADAFEYVMALNTDNATKQAILEDAGFDLNALVAMMG